jgi:hypothetical protein
MKRPFLVLSLLLAAAAELGAATRVGNLTSDFDVNPLGVDVAAPRLGWQLVDDARGARQTAWQVLVASTRELLGQGRGDLWDSGKVDSDRSALVPYGGRPLASSQRVFWKVRAWDAAGRAMPWSEAAEWTMGVLRADDWRAKWIGAPAHTETLLLRREFTVKTGLVRALLHVSGLGQYEAFLNGPKVGTAVLSPGWTDYRDTVLYDTHDVTAQLRPGQNTLGLALGNGMYRVERPEGRFAKFVGSYGELRAIAQVRLEYADGTVENVSTDEQWRTHAGPITFSSIYGGEDFDARLLPGGWTEPGFDARDWDAAVANPAGLGTLRGHSFAAEPLGPIETRAPVSVRQIADGVVLYDFGQNASFMPRLRVSGPAGSVVRLVPGEVVTPDGEIERGTMGGAHRGSAWWQYIKATDGAETWFPQFYYLGSRYIRAELKPAAANGALPRIESLEMTTVHSQARPVGNFAASNPRLNQIRDLVRWAQRSNMVSVLTDCPHREKLGWIEQYHLNGPSIRYEFDVTRIYAKGLRDMAEAQTADGLVPNIAPEYTEFKGAFRNAAEWGAAFVLVPWQQYVFTADDEPMRAHYDAMKRYFAFLESHAPDDILSDGLGDWYDYQLGTNGRANLTPAPITATAFFFEDARTLARIAEQLGRTDDARQFAARAEQIRARYVARFRDPATGRYGTGSQASLAIPLAMGLVEPADRARVLAALVKDVEEKGYASAGDIGFRYLLLALAQAGRSDVIYRLIDQDEKPGYGYQIKHGATALTESWHASNGASHNHFMLGQVIEWFYASLAGLAPDEAEPGFKRTIVRPQPVGDLTWAEASHDSAFGHHAVRWERAAGKFVLKLTVPPNTRATVFMPAHDAAKVNESDQPAAQSEGVRFVRAEGDRAVFDVAAGSYVFSSAW